MITKPISVLYDYKNNISILWLQKQYRCFCYLQIESNQGSGDDTALNAIKLLCGTSTEGDDNGYTITSGMGKFGDWYDSYTKCQPGEFLTAFRLQVEPNQVRY